MSKDIDDLAIKSFRSLCRRYQLATFAAITVSYPFIMLWVLCVDLYEGIVSGIRVTGIEWRGMHRHYRQLWEAIEVRERKK